MEHWKRRFLLRVPRTPQSDSFPAALFRALRKKKLSGLLCHHSASASAARCAIIVMGWSLSHAMRKRTIIAASCSHEMSDQMKHV